MVNFCKTLFSLFEKKNYEQKRRKIILEIIRKVLAPLPVPYVPVQQCEEISLEFICPIFELFRFVLLEVLEFDCTVIEV